MITTKATEFIFSPSSSFSCPFISFGMFKIGTYVPKWFTLSFFYKTKCMMPRHNPSTSLACTWFRLFQFSGRNLRMYDDVDQGA
jgi:hypothetical protein